MAEGADIDLLGVGHEKSPNSMHMTYMRHPMELFNSVEEIESYPFPDYASADGSHQAEQVKDQGTGPDRFGEYADHDLGERMVHEKYGRAVLRYDGRG